MAKFSAKIPTDLDDEIGKIKLAIRKGKGVAIEYALHLARLKPDHPMKNWGDGKDKPCNLGITDEAALIFTDFRSDYRPVLSYDNQFFNTAVRLGCSIYADGYRLSDTAKFETATLVPPKKKPGHGPKGPDSDASPPQ